MLNAFSKIPEIKNEPIKSYAPKSPERRELRQTIEAMAAEDRELPLLIGGKEVRSDKKIDVRAPHKHSQKLGTLYQGGAKEIENAIVAAKAAKDEWGSASFDERAAVLLRAAELLAGRFRQRVNAATMLGQSKTPHQAEIDSACELIDFWRFNVAFARQILNDQPYSSPGMWNRVDYRPLDGFVLAVSPFNFTSIAGNLPTAPALMGNTVLWKPATTAALSAQYLMEVLTEAGLPPGVINLVHAPGRLIGEIAIKHPDLAGIHFTGSTGTFQHMWKTVGENIASYNCYPRLVGETGGKDFIFAHSSCDVEALATAALRGGFEYQGQKCSAASRIYVPASIWKEFAERFEAKVKEIKVGDVTDFSNFMGAVIDANAYSDIKGYIDYAKNNPGGKVWLGGNCDDAEGYFIDPTVVIAEDPKHKLMREEIFGPVVTIHKFEDNQFNETLRLCDSTSPYALTGAIFSRDIAVVRKAMHALRFAAGNFYINDKPTGAVVGQQPFGGSRASGTNDKAGSLVNIMRWTSPRSIKETFDPPRDWKYPYMAAE
ncbi:MAG: 1-pyrroline-5-carboxylate dehydrogenase [Deltaproteobacteria bacterium RIFOXYB12_FULL_58_9]|nr:MAG: 1-pyrroline-5-carboxylate dehydrogenase [Deltaproteobacteria bacterium RIFOXYB12_FULL_58_9]